MDRSRSSRLAWGCFALAVIALPGGPAFAAGDLPRSAVPKGAPLQVPSSPAAPVQPSQAPSKGAAPSPVMTPALKASPIYMTIQGIPGEAKGGKIAVLSFRQAGGQAGTAAGPGGGPHRAGQVVITKNVDKASPQLMQAAMIGKQFNVVLFEFVQTAPGGAAHVYKTTKLTNAMVSSVRSIGSGDRPQEEVTFVPEKIE